ncbi:hypothetical protein SNE40_000962 [Patella caerulea]|uniref:Glycosyltransferase 2-like domain-containing protein n=1 Tax=Patella caerulea TaxID=87958 RepID=A0AAN8KD31_PATCE
MSSNPDLLSVTLTLKIHFIHRPHDRRSHQLHTQTRSHQLEDLLKGILRKHLRPPDSEYNFNVSVSDAIPLSRHIDDTRPKGCDARIYKVPIGVSVSVIVIFYNEAFTTLMRTAHSVLERSPKSMLKELILVDDFSSNKDLGHDLDIYVKALDPRVHILRNSERQGLVRSRLHGANMATGDVLVWLDAHTECNVGWLEPLVYELYKNNFTIVQPHVDVISSDTIQFFAYPGDVYRGGFGWDLRYAWYKLPKYLSQVLTSKLDPFPTPILVGCAIAARKDYFVSTGQFDEGLNIWGGEHFDLSFRTWLCGGRILTVPCSRVGHMFKQFAYDFNGDRSTIIRKNLMRVADIWLDEYKWIFESVSLIFGQEPQVSVEEIHSRVKRKHLRKTLNCKPFRWFLENVMPEIRIPTKLDDFFGEITNHKTAQCWGPLLDGYIAITNECFMHRILPENHFSLDKISQLVHDGQCVYMDESNLLLRKTKCLCIHERKGRGWKFNVVGKTGGQLIYKDTRGMFWCAKHVTNITPLHFGKQMVQMGRCNHQDPYQIWTFTYKLTEIKHNNYM